jgi:hypothetical protein
LYGTSDVTFFQKLYTQLNPLEKEKKAMDLHKNQPKKPVSDFGGVFFEVHAKPCRTRSLCRILAAAE